MTILPHATRSQLGGDLVMGDRLADHVVATRVHCFSPATNSVQG